MKRRRPALILLAALTAVGFVALLPNLSSIVVAQSSSNPITTNTFSVPSGNTPGISTQASAGTGIGGPITDTATLSGGTNPTGTISFSLYGPDDATCARTAISTSSKTVSGNGAVTSDPYTPSQAGTYRWTALYSGDGSNFSVSSGCNAANESVTVSATSATTAVSNQCYLYNTCPAGYQPYGGYQQPYGNNPYGYQQPYSSAQGRFTSSPTYGPPGQVIVAQSYDPVPYGGAYGSGIVLYVVGPNGTASQSAGQIDPSSGRWGPVYLTIPNDAPAGQYFIYASCFGNNYPMYDPYFANSSAYPGFYNPSSYGSSYDPRYYSPTYDPRLDPYAQNYNPGYYNNYFGNYSYGGVGGYCTYLPQSFYVQPSYAQQPAYAQPANYATTPAYANPPTLTGTVSAAPSSTSRIPFTGSPTRKLAILATALLLGGLVLLSSREVFAKQKT